MPSFRPIRVAHLLDAPAVEPATKPALNHRLSAAGRAMQQASTAAVLARGLGLDPAAAPVEVLLNPLKTATGSMGGTAARRRPASLWRRCGHPTAAEARPPCSGPPAELDRIAWRRSDAKASLRWRPVAHPTSTADGALVCSLQCVSSTRDAACGPSEQGSDLCLAAVM